MRLRHLRVVPAQPLDRRAAVERVLRRAIGEPLEPLGFARVGRRSVWRRSYDDLDQLVSVDARYGRYQPVWGVTAPGVPEVMWETVPASMTVAYCVPMGTPRNVTGDRRNRPVSIEADNDAARLDREAGDAATDLLRVEAYLAARPSPAAWAEECLAAATRIGTAERLGESVYDKKAWSFPGAASLCRLAGAAFLAVDGQRDRAHAQADLLAQEWTDDTDEVASGRLARLRTLLAE